MNDGHAAEQTLDANDARELMFPGLRSALFGPDSCSLVDGAHLTDEVLQRIIANLCFTLEKAGQRRQAVSYSTLGINQLGAVYEGLMAYSGFLATEALFEVDKDGDPDNGSWVIPVDRADELPEDVFLTEEGLDGSTKRVRYEEGDFVFRLSGRDRQRSASYYTPALRSSQSDTRLMFSSRRTRTLRRPTSSTSRCASRPSAPERSSTKRLRS